ncbi:MAG: calcium-binding protein [Betaproteobacteria bacterium]|nr:calcium-binding protein [Betaproteobacteria bacterium]
MTALGGNDRIEAFEGNDIIDTGSGNDYYVDAGPGNDLVRTGSGNDWVILGGAFDGGSDTLDGGDGYDTVRYEYNRDGFNGSIQFTGTVSTGIQIDPQGGTDVISNVEELQVNAGSGNDLIIGDPVLRNWFEGGQGNDTLSGGQINDWLRGGSGADSIVGLGGNDWIVVSGSSDDGNDTIDGGEGFDTVEYNWWAWDRAIVFTSVFVPGTTNYAQIDPAGGIDTILNVEQVAIWGGRGNDILTGDPGNNELRGRQGADTLTGGGGNDTFVVQLSESDNGVSVNLNQPADLITDFGVGDVIQVRDWTPTALLTGVSTSSLLAGQALVLSGNNGEVVLHVGADSVAGSDLSVSTPLRPATDTVREERLSVRPPLASR